MYAYGNRKKNINASTPMLSGIFDIATRNKRCAGASESVAVDNEFIA
jgi:hypothetical protein